MCVKFVIINDNFLLITLRLTIVRFEFNTIVYLLQLHLEYVAAANFRELAPDIVVGVCQLVLGP